MVKHKHCKIIIHKLNIFKLHKFLYFDYLTIQIKKITSTHLDFSFCCLNLYFQLNRIKFLIRSLPLCVTLLAKNVLILLIDRSWGGYQHKDLAPVLTIFLCTYIGLKIICLSKTRTITNSRVFFGNYCVLVADISDQNMSQITMEDKTQTKDKINHSKLITLQPGRREANNAKASIPNICSLLHKALHPSSVKGHLLC